MIKNIIYDSVRLEQGIFKDLSLGAIALRMPEYKDASTVLDKKIQDFLNSSEKFNTSVSPLNLEEPDIAWDVSQILCKEFQFADVVINSLASDNKTITYAVGMEIQRRIMEAKDGGLPKVYFTPLYYYYGANKFDVEALFFNPDIEILVDQVADAFEKSIKALIVYKMEKVLEK